MKLKLTVTDTNHKFLKKIAVFKFNKNEHSALFYKLVDLEFYNKVTLKNMFDFIENSDYIFELVQNKKYSIFRRTKIISRISLFKEQITEDLIRLLPADVLEKLSISNE